MENPETTEENSAVEKVAEPVDSENKEAVVSEAAPAAKTSAEILESGAKKLLYKKFTLEGALGKGWKERCMGEMKDVLTEEELKMFLSAKTVTQEGAQTETEKQASEMNEFFAKNEKASNTRVITGEDGNQRLLVLSNIGEDIFYQMMNPSLAFFDGDETLALGPEQFGLVSKDGKFFSIDKLISEGGLQENDHTFVFVEQSGKDYRQNMCVTSTNKKVDIVTQTPHSVENLGSLLHELGHLIRKKEFKKDRESFAAAWEVMSEYSNTEPGESFLPFDQLRQLKVLEERGAWAIGMQILKDAGSSAGLESGSLDSLKRIDQRAQDSLATYDEGSFNKKGLDDTQLIPSFAKEKRMTAKRLRQEILNSGKKYSDAPNFDPATGRTVHDPAEIMKILFGDKGEVK